MIAKNTWAAMKGREALKITWDDGPNGTFDSVSYKAYARRERAQSPDVSSAPKATPTRR